MPEASFENSSDFLLFGNTFVPGGYVFPAPRYYVETIGPGELVVTRPQSSASTAYYNINPNITLRGPGLSFADNGRLSGTITHISFASDNRGEIGEITDISVPASRLSEILVSRINGDNLSGNKFNEFLADVVDTLSLGSGDDTVRDIGFLKELSTVHLGDGKDTFYLSRPDDDARTIDGGQGKDTLVIYDFGQADTLIVDLSQQRITTNDTSVAIEGFEVIHGNPFVDKYIGSHNRDIIRAAGQDDRIFGHGGNDRLIGGWGDDLIAGHSGRDRVSGEEGSDRLYGGAGRDRMYGGEGNDRLSGGVGDDLMWGGIDADRMWGGSGNDRMWGGNGNDRLVGGAGNDQLSGDDGRDTLVGGAGADTFIFQAASGLDRIRDFSIEDGDRLSLEAQGAFQFDEQSLTLTNRGFRIDVVDIEADQTGRMRVRFDQELMDDLTLEQLQGSIDFA